jgi:hypothetical protein
MAAGGRSKNVDLCPVAFSTEGLVMAMSFIEKELRWPRSAQAAVFGRRVGESRCAKVVRRIVFFYSMAGGGSASKQIN